MREGIITEVARDHRWKGRYRISLAGGFSFEVSEDVLVKYRLIKGAYVDERLLAEVLATEEQHRAYVMALRYLGIRPRTGWQVEAYLAGKGVPPEMARQVRDRCEAEGYVDDAAYAERWVTERLRGKARGAHALRQELARQGVAREIIDRAVGRVTDQDELDAARRWVLKRLKHRSLPLSPEEERRVLSALSRKGFSFAAVTRIKRMLRYGTLERGEKVDD